MRKAKKEQIQKIVELLKRVTKVLAETDRVEHIETVIVVLQECQEAVIAIAACIEKEETEIHSTIPKLEIYCEKLYQFSIDMSNENLKQIEDALCDMETAIESIVIKKTVCFLPYKASMWDSLESVWKAACEDTECNAYVIPIPYFDRKPDGSFGEMHYEGDLYPSYVPITSYEDFHLWEEKPDKIFFHNPYDEFNFVTSVHPMFYSSRLKEYTDELIYIPYFVLSEIDSEDEQAVDGMSHFCKTSGVVNADKVIVQSEQIKRAYVKVLTKWKGEETKEIWEKKILGLGSPKLDKVANTRKEDIEIPEGWLSVIKKTDGSWKKIILYNTVVSGLLEHGTQMFKKMENVFRIFEENKDEVVLLWRPHPLNESTLEAMRPELLEKYQMLVKRYKDEQIGIYDDTSDLNRAIGISDAYFGDPSSVVQLCQKAGMPVMIQDVGIGYEE